MKRRTVRALLLASLTLFLALASSAGAAVRIAGALSKSLCHVFTVAATGPTDQLTIAGAPVSVRATATDSGGAALSFSATGLPAGLAIDSGSGLITGTPRLPGPSHVTVTARDQYGNVGSAGFTWTVGPGPLARRLLGATMVGLAQGKPRLNVAEQAHRRLGAGALRASDALVRRASEHHLGALPVKLTVADTARRGHLRFDLEP
jgi:hypothetical protein